MGGDFCIKTKDNSVILCGHSMQFPISQASEVIVFNRGERFESKAPDGTKSLEWVSQYGFTGINAFHENAPDTGMNEAGLSFNVLVLQETKYPEISPNEYSRALAMTDVSHYFLSLCATVSQVKEQLGTVFIYEQFIKEMKEVPGLHIALHDAEGHHAVIEFIDGKVQFNDNPNGVLTNDPPLQLQLQNLKGYQNLTPSNSMRGMPGSWMPDDRFVSLSLEVQKAKATNQKEALDSVVKILNASDLPNDVATCKLSGRTFAITTIWQSIMDLKQKIFYFRPHSDTVFRAIDLKMLKLEPGTKHPRIPVHTNSMTVIDVTNQLNPVIMHHYNFAGLYNYMTTPKNEAEPKIAELEYPIHTSLSIETVTEEWQLIEAETADESVLI